MMVRIARLIGSAGSGKTTELIRIMEGARDGLGCDPTSIGLLSFTRAARQEAAERAAAAWNVTPESLTRDGWIRTGHSVCYRQLGLNSEQVISDKRADQEWLANAFGVRLATSIDDESGRQCWIGDPRVSWCLNAWDLHRASMVPLEEVVRRLAVSSGSDAQDVSEVITVAEHYEIAKNSDGRVDYTDFLSRFAGVSFSPRYGISRVTPEGELPPVQTWLFDEQQDASPLLDAVCKRLVSGPDVKWAYVVGDPFQAIYGFAGSNADCFLAWPAEKQKIMPKSYRCPKPILDLGEKCLQRMTREGGYFDRKVSPADHDGQVLHVTGFESLENLVKGDEEWMFVARTNFHCKRIFGFLGQLGIPARSTKANSEPTVRQRGMSALMRLEMGEGVSAVDWARAVDILPSRTKESVELLKRGSKKRWKSPAELASQEVVFPYDLIDVGCTDSLVKMILDGSWASYVDYGTTWRDGAKKWGIENAMSPRVMVGTVHSAKGMEAKNVVVLTTTSRIVANGEKEVDQSNEECRIAYVAVTRAKERLFVLNEGTSNLTPRMECLA